MPEIENRRRRLAAALFLLGPLLAGCSSAAPSMPSFSSLFGSGSNSAAAASNASGAVTRLDFECPGVSVRQGAGSYSLSANPAEPSTMNLRYQLTIAETARECRRIGNMLTIKVGVQGRVVLGPAGGPGQLDVPLRFAVVREAVDPQTITTKLQHVAVTIPSNDPHVLFTHVEDGLTFPMPPGNEIDSYVVYIGFDPLAVRDPEKKPPKRSRPRRQG
jgi:hypothetical protein